MPATPESLVALAFIIAIFSTAIWAGIRGDALDGEYNEEYEDWRDGN